MEGEGKKFSVCVCFYCLILCSSGAILFLCFVFEMTVEHVNLSRRFVWSCVKEK